MCNVQASNHPPIISKRVLSDLKDQNRVLVYCHTCGMGGAYSIWRLLQLYGPDQSLSKLLSKLDPGCPLTKTAGSNFCGLHFKGFQTE
jgi:hypothetical protein